MGTLMYNVRQQLNLGPEQALFFFVNDKFLCRPNQAIGVVYDKYVSDDGFLYITFNTENTFGNHLKRNDV